MTTAQEKGLTKFNHKQILDDLSKAFPDLYIKDLGNGICDIWKDTFESDLIGTIEAKHKTRKQFYTIYLTFHLRPDVLEFVIEQYTEQIKSIQASKQGFNAYIDNRLTGVITLI